MRDPENIIEVARLNPDFMGFIFHEPSPRHCEGLPQSVIKSLPLSITTVAVTVDKDFDQIMGIIDKYGFRAVQLHGDETPHLCSRIRSEGIAVMKAVSVSNAESIARAQEYAACADMLVLDTPTSKKGGSGRKFDWTILQDITIPVDFLLSGGISPNDANAIKALALPRLRGVDLNSRFEISAGIKSTYLLNHFIDQL